MKFNTLGRLTGIKTPLFFLLLMALPFSINAKQVVDDSDGDGLSDQYENKIGTEAYLADTDGDGINDAIEVGKNLDKPLDSDGDKLIDVLDFDDDNDGLPSILETKNDSDKDGLLNYLDPDSDNDGVTDGIEAGMLGQDLNHDFIDDAFDSEKPGAVDKNGDGINDNLKLADHNNDGIPDYLDAKYHKPTGKEVAKNEALKSAPKKAKKITKKEDEKEKVVINRYTDTDNDGLLDTQEKILGTNPNKRDSDNDKVSDAIEIGLDINAPQDSDHDGIIDALDEDDDNDGVLTKNEDINKDGSPINDDIDDDGVPNFLDANDDGDQKLTREEGSTKDSDNDGILDYLDKNDGVKDIASVTPKEQKIPEKPEVVVLFDGDAAALAEQPMDNQELDIAADITDVESDDNQSIAEAAINDAIEKADKEMAENVSNPAKKKEGGIMAWLTSLLPD